MCVGVVAGSFAFFATIRALFTCLPPPGSVQQTWRWYNVSISWIHALVITSGCVYCLINDPKLLQSLHHYDVALAYTLVQLSVGYFIYDAFDVAISLPVKQSCVLLCHHVVVLMCFSIVVKTGNHVPIAIVSLLVEINSVFLHARQLLRISKIYDGLIYTVNKIANIVTFVIFRFVSLVWMFRRIVLYRNEFTRPIMILLTCCFPLMIAINVGLFMQVLAKDVPAITFLWRFRAGSKKDDRYSSEANGNGVANTNSSNGKKEITDKNM